MIYLVRHGQTDWNKKKIIQGWVNNVSLNDLGRKQAYALANSFRKKHLSYIISSPIERAFQTAQIIAHQKNIRVFTDNHFKEIDYGVWSGKTGHEIKKLYPDEWEKFVENPEEFRFKKGESIKDFYSRVSEGIENLKKEDDILIVTHVNTIRMIFAHILNMPIKNAYSLHIENCGVSGIKYRNGRWEVNFLNCRII
jgi:broad specificity phosphatase PhoE